MEKKASAEKALQLPWHSKFQSNQDRLWHSDTRRPCRAWPRRVATTADSPKGEVRGRDVIVRQRLTGSGYGVVMYTPIPRSERILFTLALTVTAMLLPANASAMKCSVPDNGNGTIDMPPAGCDYVAPVDPYVITDGLPPGTTIELRPTHTGYTCGDNLGICSVPMPPPTCELPGGGLGGTVGCSEQMLELEVVGTGLLAGFTRLLNVPVSWEMHTASRTLGATTQSFDTDLVSMRGDLFGDPDFDFLQIRAGSIFGLPSPGHTNLHKGFDGNWTVDSFFDVAYTIDFQGAPGSVLEGLAGSTQGGSRIEAGTNPCIVSDNGSETVTLPLVGCEYISADERTYQLNSGLPPNTTIEMDPAHRLFVCAPGPSATCSAAILPAQCEASGGGLGGSAHCASHDVTLTITGTGLLAGFSRFITIPTIWEAHTSPRTPGQSEQVFDNEMVDLRGEVFGDPDFCTLRLRAGTANGLPSSGRTRLTDIGSGQFQVDSFFDIDFQIDWQGCPGSSLEGFGDTSSGTIRIQTGQPMAPAQHFVPGVPGLSGAGMWAGVGLLAVAGFWIAARRHRSGRC